MQPLNFTQLSSKKHKAVRIWFVGNIILIGTLLGICVYLTMQQWKRYKNIKILALTTTAVKNNKKAMHKNDADHVLKAVSAKLNSKANLESFMLTDATIEFKIAGNDVQIISDIAQRLQVADNKIQLAGLEYPTKNKVIGIFTYQNTL